MLGFFFFQKKKRKKTTINFFKSKKFPKFTKQTKQINVKMEDFKVLIPNEKVEEFKEILKSFEIEEQDQEERDFRTVFTFRHLTERHKSWVQGFAEDMENDR